MQIDLNKKEFYKKIVSYFKKKIIGKLYKEYTGKDYLHFSIMENCKTSSFSLWYYEKSDEIECQILDRIASSNGIVCSHYTDLDIILIYLSASTYVPFDIADFNILIKSKLI